MVYQDGGTNFQVSAKSDLPFLNIRSQPSSTGNQVQIDVGLKPQDLPATDFQGHLQLLTNDPDFPVLDIPLKGQIR